MGIPIVKIENGQGEVLNLSADPRYIPMLTGTGPPGATINRAKLATADGTRYNSATVNERNLILTVCLQRDVARARRNLYRWLGSKQYIKVYYQEDDLDVFVEGYVEAPDVNPWEQNQNVQASIICPMPYWREVKETFTNASIVSSLLEFPFSADADGIELSTKDETKTATIQNNGTAVAGATFLLTASVQTENPYIYNMDTGEYIGLSVVMEAGDQMEICTTDGSKSVTLIRAGVRYNCINTVVAGSGWPKIAPGANAYSYTVESGACDLGIYHTNMYIGV